MILPFIDQVRQVLVHGVHAVLRAGLHGGVDLVGLALADEVADGRGGHQHLGRDGAPVAVARSCQRLADDALQRAGELDAHLLLLVRREDVDDAVDGLRGVLGVQGREDEVAGLGGGQRHRDGLEVAHLADQDDVGVLAQHVLERVLERLGVLPHLALVDDALLVPVEELDRVLDGHDVLAAGAVRQVDRATARVVDLPEPVGPVTRTKPRGSDAKFATDGGTPRSSSCLISNGMMPEGGAEGVALAVDVHAEPGPARHAVGEVELEVLLELLPLLLGEGGVEHPLDDRRREDRLVLELLQLAVEPDRRAGAGR